MELNIKTQGNTDDTVTVDISININGVGKSIKIIADTLGMALHFAKRHLDDTRTVQRFLSNPEIEGPTNRLSEHMKKFYTLLPDIFTTRQFIDIGAEQGIKQQTAKAFLSKNTGKLFTQTSRGNYSKI